MVLSFHRCLFGVGQALVIAEVAAKLVARAAPLQAPTGRLRHAPAPLLLRLPGKRARVVVQPVAGGSAGHAV